MVSVPYRDRSDLAHLVYISFLITFQRLSYLTDIFQANFTTKNESIRRHARQLRLGYFHDL